MVYYETNSAGEDCRYLERDFTEDQAHILILMEEAAIALFSALPEHFVLFGGATLVLFHAVAASGARCDAEESLA